MLAFRYIAAQVASFLFDFLLFALLSMSGNSIFVSNFLSKIASGIIGFVLQRHFVFKSKQGAVSRQFMLYFLLWIANIFGTSWMVVQIDALIDNRYVAKLFTDGIAFILNYLISRHFIFTSRARAKMSD